MQGEYQKRERRNKFLKKKIVLCIFLYIRITFFNFRSTVNILKEPETKNPLKPILSSFGGGGGGGLGGDLSSLMGSLTSGAVGGSSSMQSFVSNDKGK